MQWLSNPKQPRWHNIWYIKSCLIVCTGQWILVFGEIDQLGICDGMSLWKGLSPVPRTEYGGVKIPRKSETEIYENCNSIIQLGDKVWTALGTWKGNTFKKESMQRSWKLWFKNRSIFNPLSSIRISTSRPLVLSHLRNSDRNSIIGLGLELLFTAHKGFDRGVLTDSGVFKMVYCLYFSHQHQAPVWTLTISLLVIFVFGSVWTTIMVKSSWDDAYWIWNYDPLLYPKAIVNIGG